MRLPRRFLCNVQAGETDCHGILSRAWGAVVVVIHNCLLSEEVRLIVVGSQNLPRSFELHRAAREVQGTRRLLSRLSPQLVLDDVLVFDRSNVDGEAKK